MPKLTNSLPKYRKHRASGQAVVTLGGRDHYLGPHGTAVSKREYDRLIGEFLARGRRGGGTGNSGLTVIEVLAAYWKFAQQYYRKNDKPTNELDAMRLVSRDTKAIYGDTIAEEFGPLALKAVRQRWIDRGQSRPTVNKNMRRVTRIFRWAVAEEMIPGTVLHSLLAVPGLKKGRCGLPEPLPVKPVDLAVVEQTIPNLSPIVADMVRFELLTGCRPGEVCMLRPDAIDRSNDVWEFLVGGHKTEHHGRTRTVFIGPESQNILRPYLLRANDAYCFSPAEAREHETNQRSSKRVTPLSCGNRPGTNRKRKPEKQPGNQYTNSSYRRAVHNACDRSFLPPEPLKGDELKAWQSKHRWSPNQLRHTRGTDIRKRFGLEAAQVILGHAAADVTQIYAERDAEKAREVARKIG